MARGLNKAMLIGNVGNDPEIRVAGQGGNRVANFSLATNRSWTDRNSGQKQERTEWHAITVWGSLVDVVEQWVKKGDRLYVEGRIEYSKSGEGDTAKYYTNIILSEMVMLGSANNSGGQQSRGSSPQQQHSGGGGGGGGGGGSPQQQYSGGGGGGRNMTDPDDDLPF